MTNYTFGTLGKWAQKTKRRTDAVIKDAAQTTVQIIQLPKAKGGRMPVVTSNLRNSLMSSVAGGAMASGAENYVMVTASMKGGDVATFTWGNGEVPYARRVNNGFTGTDSIGRTYAQAGAHFVEGGVDQWPATLRGSVAKAKARVR